MDSMVKYNSQLAVSEKEIFLGNKPIPANRLLYFSFEDNIPAINYHGVITILMDEYGRINFIERKPDVSDPSTIYTKAEICEAKNVPPPPYYWPHYLAFTPDQRWEYLSWLSDITKPIDIGYVFLYYYGLESHLITGEFEKAVDEIITLRNHHNNRSFQKYSEMALIYGCIMNNRLDMLLGLQERTNITRFSNAQFLLSYQLRLNLTTDQVLLIAKHYPTVRYGMVKDLDLFKEILNIQFSQKYPDGFPIYQYDISNTIKINEQRFCNYSFPREIQFAVTIDFYNHKGIMTPLEKIILRAYDIYKEKRKEQSRLKRLNLTAAELKEREKNKRIEHYKRLLKKQLINQKEFDLLVSSLQNLLMLK